jgi:hypothetical protein
MEESSPQEARPDYLDFTPLARCCGFRFNVRIAREIVDRANDENVLRALLHAASDALMMRSSRLQAMFPLVFAIKALRAPAQFVTQSRLTLRFDNRHAAEHTVTLGLAG